MSLPFPDGLFEQLAERGASLLEPMDAWKPLGSTQVPFAIFTRSSDRPGEPPMCCGTGTFPYQIDEVVDVMVRKMAVNSQRWDRTCQGVEVLHKWTDTDWLYRYRVNPGWPFDNRDIVYYEGWREDAQGRVINVSASMGDPHSTAFPAPKGCVRMRIWLHYKRFTPVDGGTRYETIQQMDLCGNMPPWLTNGPTARALRSEFEGFARIIEEDRRKGVSPNQ